MTGDINMGCHNIVDVGDLKFCVESSGAADVLDMRNNNIVNAFKTKTSSLTVATVEGKHSSVPIVVGQHVRLDNVTEKKNLTCKDVVAYGDIKLASTISGIENIHSSTDKITLKNDVQIVSKNGSNTLFAKRVVYPWPSGGETAGGLDLVRVNSLSGIGNPAVIDFQGDLRQPDPASTTILNAPTRSRSDVETFPDRLVSYNNIKSFFTNPTVLPTNVHEARTFALPSKRICDISNFINLPMKHFNLYINGTDYGSADTTPVDLREKNPFETLFAVGVGKQAKNDPDPKVAGVTAPPKQMNPKVDPFTFQQIVSAFGIFMNPEPSKFRTSPGDSQVDNYVRCKPWMTYQDAKLMNDAPGIYKGYDGKWTFYDEAGRAENWRSVCRYYTSDQKTFKGAQVVLPDGWARSFEHYWDQMPASKDVNNMPGKGFAHAFPTISYNYNGDSQGFDANFRAGLLEQPESFVPSTYPKRVRFCLILINKDKDPKHNFDDVTFHKGPVIWYYDILSQSIHNWDANITIPANSYYGVGIVAEGSWNDRPCPLFGFKSTNALIPQNLNQRGDDPYYWRSPYSLVSLSSTKEGPAANRVIKHAVGNDGPVWCPYIPAFVPKGRVHVPLSDWLNSYNCGRGVHDDLQLPQGDKFLGICAMMDYWLSNPGKTREGNNLVSQHLDDKWNDKTYNDALGLLKNFSPQGYSGNFGEGRAGLLPEYMSFKIEST